MVIILFLVALASAAPIFQNTPSDQTVVEGGDATFSCDATLGGARRLLNYRIRNGTGGLLESVRRNITDLSMVNGVVGACVLGEFNSQLVLKGVTREANGYTVTCSILNEDELTFTDQTQPPGTMSVIVPPGAPEAVAVSGVGPFSATVSWQPPLEDGGAVGPLMYTITLTNTSDSTTFKFNPTAALTMNLANLRHSVTYRVQVVAGNEAGMGPAAEVMFRTNDTVPTVGGVEALALTLDTVQVDVTVSDDGGQPVLEYTVTVSGTTVMFSRSRGNVTGVSLMNGVTYTVSVVARNSVGDSETFTSSFSVPFPPNITMQPVAVTPDETSTRCCAGVRVFLEDSSDPTLVFTAQVRTEGSPFTARNVTREGDVVYVQGLQAGTPYNIRLTAWNNFGSVTKEVSTTPLIGFPSDPSMPVVSVEGSSVSIQLSTRYPGTNARGQFRFSLIFSIASTAKRQSLQPTEVQVDPTGLDSSVTTTHTLTDVAAGSYSVSVMAENEHGMSQEMIAPFVVEILVSPSAASSTDLIPAVITPSAALVIVTALLAVAIVIIILQHMRIRKLSSVQKDGIKGPNSYCDDMEMEPQNCPKSGPSKSTTEPQYEVCGEGVTSNDIKIEENPAYQSVAVPGTRP